MPNLRLRPYSRKLTPVHAHTLASEYHSGSDVRALMKKYNIGRTTFYRYLKENKPKKEQSPTWWKLECQRLKEVVVDLSLQLAAAKKALNKPTDPQ